MGRPTVISVTSPSRSSSVEGDSNSLATEVVRGRRNHSMVGSTIDSLESGTGVSLTAAAAAVGKKHTWWTALGLGSVSVMARSLRNQNTGWVEMHGSGARLPHAPDADSQAQLTPPPSTALERSLFEAIDQRSLERVTQCLDAGANVNAVHGFFGESALHHAARVRWRAGVELLLGRGAQANIENRFLQTPLHFAAVSGCAECMAALLVRDKTSLQAHDMRGFTPLHDAAVGSDPRCVQLLINAGADVNVVDRQADTPLHKCAKSGEVASIVALLNEGADLKAKNCEGETALAMMLRNIPNALNRVLDHCLASNKVPKNHKNFELTINFRPLTRNSAMSNTDILRNFIKIGEAEVLKHPVCQALLELKWHHVVKLFLFKLFFYVVFVLVATVFTLQKFDSQCYYNTTVNCSSRSSRASAQNDTDQESESGLHVPFYWISVVMIAILMVTELVNILSSAANYFVDVMSYVNWILFIMFFVISTDYNSPWQVHVAAFFTLFLWGKAMHMIGQFPSCGIYVSMFTKVAKVISKMFVVYFSLLLAFSVSFHICFKDRSFNNPGNSFLKTLTLMIGEVDYGDLFFGQSPLLFGTSHVIFFMFIVLMSIILSNLLVALAVSDVQGLRQGAHLERLKKQSQLIHETELMRAFFKTLFRCHRPHSIIHRLLQSFHLDLLSTRVFILPNHPQKSRYLQILDYNTKTLGEHKVSKDIVDLFWRALQGQESGDYTTGPCHSPSILNKSATLCRRPTVRHLADGDGALRAHRGREVAAPPSINLNDFKDLISGMEARLSEQIRRQMSDNGRDSAFSTTRSKSLWLKQTSNKSTLEDNR